MDGVYLQRVVTECNAGNLQAHRIPVLIRLREFVEDGREVAYAVERYLERCWRLSVVEVQLVLDSGRSLMLLDGLDEVTGADGQAIAKQIKRFVRAYPQVQVIVTCRTQSHESRFERFDYVEVADFNEPQVRAFAEHWFHAVCEDLTTGQVTATAFLNQLFGEENKAIRELAITPILLSLTCAVFQQKQAFYSKRSKLYEEGLELFLEQWDKSREIDRDEIYRDLSIERKLELISYLAVKKFEQTQYVLFEQVEIEGYIAEFLGIGLRESRGVLRAIEAQHGLLIERSRGIWSFSHLTFQEYLVAKWFCENEDWSRLVSRINERRWREVFLLAVEETKNSDVLFLLMRKEIDKIISGVPEIQRFLMWLSQKADSIKSIYKPAAIRALYLAALNADINIVTGLHRVIDPSTVNLSIDKYRFLDSNSDGSWDVTLDYALSLEKVPEKTEIFIASTLDPQFGRELSRLSKQVEMRHFDREKFETWWIINGCMWREEYRKQLIKYRNIGHNWKFSLSQKQKIESYCYSNELLLICMRDSTTVSPSIKSRIEDSLLLPDNAAFI